MGGCASFYETTMDKNYEIAYHTAEETGWWFCARRDMILRLLKGTNTSAHILDVGCSSGVLLADLASHGYAYARGIDISERAVERCRARGVERVSMARGERTGFPDNSFDVVIASDTLEHIRDDAGALKEWRRILRPQGRMIIFVPAHPFLWSVHDEINQHIQRYRKCALGKLVERSGFTIERIGWWDCLLFFPAIIFRALRSVMRGKSESYDPVLKHGGLIQKVFLQILLVENFFIAHSVPLPIGVSLFVVARKNTLL